ncbi:MAG TPA: thioredoxin domain-containing protein [Candidatus Nanopelagicales bacterium]
MAPEPSNAAKSAKTPKQLAAEARAASEAAERRRERTIRIIGSIAVVLIVGGLLAVGFFARQSGDTGASAAPAPTPNPSAPAPKGVQTTTWGVPYGTGWTSPDEAKLPTMEIWEDFQCPFCAQFEQAAGKQIEALAEAGKVKLLYRPAIFLDQSLAAKNAAAGNPNSSARATNAWGCAIDQDKTAEYHNAVFAAAPSAADEGKGYSEQQLLELGTQVGVADQAAFTKCVQDGTYLAWAANSNQVFLDENIGGTPKVLLNGTEIQTAEFADMAAIEAKIAAATAQ